MRQNLLIALTTGLAFVFGALGVFGAASTAAAFDIEFEGNLELEARHFLKAGPHEHTKQDFSAVAGEVELGLYSRDSRHAVIIKPYARYDRHDHQRSHADLREAKYRYVNQGFEAAIGVDKEFWGVTEFLHLVDIINQTDNVESVDGEQKLGQPMAKISYVSSYGVLTAYALPYFRIRQFFDPLEGRPNFGFVVDNDTVLFESGETGGSARFVDDFALRYSHNIGALDLGLSWFDGTARTPQLIVVPPPEMQATTGQPVLTAYYAYLQQVGIDAQATLGSWLLKLEAIQPTQSQYSGAQPVFGVSPLVEIDAVRATGGFEYTFYNLFGSSTDLGLVVEYMWDEREEDAPHMFGQDIGIGLRWTANDTQSTTILLGGLVDVETQSSSISLEAERRIGTSFKAIVEARLQDKVGENDARAEAARDEDFIRLRLAWYF